METEAVLGIATLVITAVGTCVAIYVVNQWKAERKFDTHFDIARRFALLAYRFNDEFLYAQSPVGPFPHEYKDRERKDDEDNTTVENNNMRYAHLKRLNPLFDLLEEMKGVNWEAKATTGEDFKDFIDQYEEAARKLRFAVMTVFNIPTRKAIESGRPDAETKAINMEKQENILYGNNEGEELRASVKETTERLTKVLSKHTFGKNR